MPGVEGNVNVVSGLADKKFARPTFGRWLGKTRSFQSAINCFSFLARFNQMIANQFTLLLEVESLHVAKGAETFGRIEKTTVQCCRLPIKAAAGFPVTVCQRPQSKWQPSHQEQECKNQDCY
jgi:hypothetical protein